MEPEDYDDEDQPVYESKTLTQGSPVLIETLNESTFIGEILSTTIPGVLILQKVAEITPEDLRTSSPDDFALSNPIEAFIPFASIHYIQSIQDISTESLIADLREDMDNYHNPEEETDSTEPEEEETEPTSRWADFITLLDRILKKFGV